MAVCEPLSPSFPYEAEVPESKRHLEQRTLLYQFLKLAFAEVAAIGCDQFVYWDPTNPRLCLAPDAFVRFGAPDDLFRSWKVWERGAPQVAVEVISDTDEPSWEEKLERYRQLGVSELVWFNADLPDRPLRVWDFTGDDLLERSLPEPVAQSRHLGAYWVVLDQPDTGLTLRLSHDPAGTRLFPTPAEHEAEARRTAEQREREAEQRIRELEAELRRRS